jgi:hypothetical protein
MAQHAWLTMHGTHARTHAHHGTIARSHDRKAKGTWHLAIRVGYPSYIGVS